MVDLESSRIKDVSRGPAVLSCTLSYGTSQTLFHCSEKKGNLIADHHGREKSRIQKCPRSGGQNSPGPYGCGKDKLDTLFNAIGNAERHEETCAYVYLGITARPAEFMLVCLDLPLCEPASVAA